MTQTKKVDIGRWSDFLVIFSESNRGRSISIEVVNASIGDQILMKGSPLSAIDYDPAGKGDDLVISTGRESIDASHRIDGPEEIWELQDDNGKVIALEIVGSGGTKTIVSLA